MMARDARLEARVEHARQDDAEDRDGEQTRHARDRVVHAGCDAALLGVDRIEDDGGQRCDEAGTAESEQDRRREIRRPYEPPIPGKANATNPAPANSAPTTSGMRAPMCATKPPDHRESANMSNTNGSSDAPAAVGV